MSLAFSRMCRATFSTKRPPVISGGKAGVAALNLSGKKCTNPVPPSSANQLMLTLNIDAMYSLLEIHTAETDIKNIDFIVIGATEYPIVMVETRPINGELRTRVLMRKLAG